MKRRLVKKCYKQAAFGMTSDSYVIRVRTRRSTKASRYLAAHPAIIIEMLRKDWAEDFDRVYGPINPDKWLSS